MTPTRLRPEPLEDRTAPATFFVDNDLVAGTSVAVLNASHLGFSVLDQDADNVLSAGDRVTVNIPNQGGTDLTYQAAVPGTVNDTDRFAFQAIGQALAAANTAPLPDAVFVGPGTYNESLVVNSVVTLAGVTGVATDVRITPPGGSAGITVSSAGVQLRDLEVTGVAAADGIVGTALGSLDLTNVRVDNNGRAGLVLGGNGGTSLINLNGVTLVGNAGGGGTISNFNAVGVNAAGNAPAAFTAGVTSVRVTVGGTTNQAITLAGENDLLLTGSSAADTFTIDPNTGAVNLSITGGPPGLTAGNGTAGDALDLTTTSQTTVGNVTASANGFSGTVTKAGNAPADFTGIESVVQGGSISGRVFHDADRNGVRGGAETGAGGVTVTLDCGADGSAELSTTTDANGNWGFTGLPTATYRIRVRVPGRMTETTPPPADISTALGRADLNIFTGIAPPPPTGALSRNLVVGGANGTASVFVPDASGHYGGPSATLTPFAGYSGDLRVATGDVDGDGTADTVLVTGAGTPLRVAVVSGKDNSTLVAPFDPFGGDFSGGGFVAAADLDGDGKAEFVVTPDQGGGPRVTVFSLVNGSPAARANFFGIDDPNFRGGARAALGDVNGDGTPDLAVAAGFGGGPRVALFYGDSVLITPTRMVGDFFAFPEDALTLRNGAFVAVGDVDGDGKADLIFGGGPGGAPRVFVLSGAILLGPGSGPAGAYAGPLANFFVAGNASDRGGVRVAAKDADGDAKADLAVGSGEGSPARVRVYLGKDFTSPAEPAAFQDLSGFGGVGLPGGVFVG